MDDNEYKLHGLMRIARFRFRAWVTWRRLRARLFPTPVYVVVYDGWDSSASCDTEEYYGYFETPAQAREMFDSLRGGSAIYKNARICRQVETIPDLVEEHDEHTPSLACHTGMHSWIDNVGKLPADTVCTRCGETYGDPA